MRWRAEGDGGGAAPEVGKLSPGREVARSVLIVLSLIAGSLALQVVVVSDLQHRSSQRRAYGELRASIAEGTAAAGPTDVAGRALEHGRPIAYLEIPKIGVHEVVGEGTTPADLMLGPGHRRDSPFPGQAGMSIVLGRQAAYGGPFNRLSSLGKGDTISVTTGVGVARFTVTSLRYGGEPAPAPPRAGEGRLLLVAAAGESYMPSEVVRVDAEMSTPALSAITPLVSEAALPRTERIMGTDGTTLWALLLWIQALVAVAMAVVWSWHRWGRPHTWLVFSPVGGLVAFEASSQALRLLPNVM